MGPCDLLTFGVLSLISCERALSLISSSTVDTNEGNKEVGRKHSHDLRQANLKQTSQGFAHSCR